MPVRNKKDDGLLLWIILFLGLIAGLFSLVTWPFRAVVRRLPGRREKELQAAVDDIRVDMRASKQLLHALLAGDSKSAAKLDERLDSQERKIAEVTGAQGWPEDLEGDGPGVLVLKLLEKARIVDGVDWRSDPDAVKECLDPLLRRRGITLDWSFVKAIEATGDAEALRNTHFLPRVGDEVEKHGVVLAHVAEGSDAYFFAVCSREEFSRIDGLTCRSFTIRRLSSATGPVKEP